MSPPAAHGRGDWMSLLGGVGVSRRWVTPHTPQLPAAWCDAPTAERRRAIAARILQIAADLESEPDNADDMAAESTWRAFVVQIDDRLVRGPDWLALAAALTRAATAGYDVAVRLPALAAAAPLPARHPARELHWRLLDDCSEALPALTPTRDLTATAERTPIVHNGPASTQPTFRTGDRHDRRRGQRPAQLCRLPPRRRRRRPRAGARRHRAGVPLRRRAARARRRPHRADTADRRRPAGQRPCRHGRTRPAGRGDLCQPYGARRRPRRPARPATTGLRSGHQPAAAPRRPRRAGHRPAALGIDRGRHRRTRPPRPSAHRPGPRRAHPRQQ